MAVPYWIINTKKKTFVEVQSSPTLFDGDWPEKFAHTRGTDSFDVQAARVDETTSAGMPYEYDLCRDGGFFTLYADMTRFTDEDIKKAKAELRYKQDVVSLRVLKLKPAGYLSLERIEKILSAGSWSSSYRRQMSLPEIDYVNAVWRTMNGETTFMDALLRIRNMRLCEAGTITLEQSKKMLHALGHKPSEPYRNYYCANTNDPEWDDLVAKGFASKIDRGPEMGGVFYHVTAAGIMKLEEEI